MEIKESYKNRKIDGLFSYYPIEPLKMGQSARDNMVKWLDHHGIKTAAKKFNEDLPRLIDIDTMLGIEVEAEQVSSHLNVGVPMWQVTTDNSLRNNGREFITPPVTPQTARDALITLFSGFKKHPVEFSWRTSDHVHLNMRQDRVQHVMNLILFYTLFEDSLFSFVGDERRQSNFCVPVSETAANTYISGILTGHSHLPDLCNYWQKYTALNVRPLCYNDHAGHPNEQSGKGTIEFRHLEGTQDVSKILNWINLILCLQRASRATTISDLQDRILGITTRAHYVNLLEEVFQDHAKLLPVKEFRRILYSSVAYAKECFCPIPNIEKLIKASKDKVTGLSEMIKIRTRNKPQPSEEELKLAMKKKELSIHDTAFTFDSNTPLWPSIASQVQQANLNMQMANASLNAQLDAMAVASPPPVQTLPPVPYEAPEGMHWQHESSIGWLLYNN